MPLKTPPVPLDYIPTRRARAIITTAWNNNGYRPLTITRVENYYSETALDTDADPWQIQIGDPGGDYLDLLERNNEVRVKIFGVAGANLPIVTGIADGISYDSDGSFTLTGRDFSSLAMDSTCPPKTYRAQRAWAIVQSQARELGFTDTQLAKSGPEGNMVRKLLQTDGSESYWEFWYRLYRREKLWLWTDPNGTLHGDVLNYSSDPLYFFGEPRKTDPRSRWNRYMPVERLEINKNTQGRVGSVWVYGQKGDQAIPPAFVNDPTMNHWLKRPRKVMLDSDARTHRAAVKTAWEEIFEGKVGSVELKVTVAEPGFEIEQNQICFLNLPDPGIQGEYFVVGVRRQVGSDGFLQEVRLREKQYAVTQRVPTDPKISSSQGTQNDYATTNLSTSLAEGVQGPQDWMPYFIKAANKWHGPWDFDLYLATLLAMCQHETHFRNIRNNGHPGGSGIEWYPWKGRRGGAAGEPRGGAGLVDQYGRSRSEWQAAFANENWDGQPDLAVGPMQLLSRSLKESADDLMKAGFHDQYEGGRWVPEHNIMIAAEYLRSCLKQITHDSGRDADIYLGVAGYGQGPRAFDTEAGRAYASYVRNAVNTDPGYLTIVQNARQASQVAQKTASQQPITTPGDTSGTNPNSPTGFLNSPESLRNLRAGAGTSAGGLSWASNVDVTKVNYRLLQNLSSLAANLGRTVVITSGFRPAGQPSDKAGMAGSYGGAPGGDTQWYLWNRYIASGRNIAYIAANPVTGSNHTRGQAVDAQIGGVAIKRAISSSLLAQYGLHGTVDGDWPHITLLSVSG